MEMYARLKTRNQRNGEFGICVDGYGIWDLLFFAYLIVISKPMCARISF